MSKTKRTRNSKPVIATLINLLQGPAAKDGEGMTVPQLTKRLQTATGRPAKSLQFTVRAQLSRLPAEKGVKIKKVRDGQNVRYFAPTPVKKAA